MAPMRGCKTVAAFHEPRVGAPASGTAWLGMARSIRPCRRPALRFRGAKRFSRSENSQLDPLPSSDVGRGNPITPIIGALAWVTKRDEVFPLSFTRGEDQGETSPIHISRFEPPNRSRRREEADDIGFQQSPPPHVVGYQVEIRGEGLVRLPCVLLTKWQWGWSEGEREI